MAEVALREVELPDFGEPVVEPFIQKEVYEARIARALQRARERGLNRLVIDGDREHSG